MNLPSIEALESRHTFPCAYTIKVIGSADDNFTARVIATVRDEMRLEVDPPFRLRSTAGGRHVAVTLTPEVDTPQQVLALYSRLGQISGVVMLL